MIEGYLLYVRFDKIISILSKHKRTANYIIQKTNIPIASVYRILRSLLKNDIITTETKMINYKTRPGQHTVKVYKLKQTKKRR